MGYQEHRIERFAADAKAFGLPVVSVFLHDYSINGPIDDPFVMQYPMPIHGCVGGAVCVEVARQLDVRELSALQKLISSVKLGEHELRTQSEVANIITSRLADTSNESLVSFVAALLLECPAAAARVGVNLYKPKESI